LGAKYLIYDPFKITKKVNIYSWKANNSSTGILIPAVSVFAGANFTMADNPYSFSQMPIFLKIMLIQKPFR
jgi:hypothetical protein